MWPVPSQERGGETRGETKRPCNSNPRTSLSCCSNPRSSENSLASLPVPRGRLQMLLEAQEQGARLVGASWPRY